MYVFSATNLPSVKENTDFHHGYIIIKPLDIEHYWDSPEEEWYKCRIFSTEAKLLLSYPAMPYALCRRDEFNEHCGELTANAVDNGRISYQQNISRRQFNHILLDFPEGHVLSSSAVYVDAGEDEDLAMQIIEVTYHHENMGVYQDRQGHDIPVTNTAYYAAWMVARTDIDPNKKGTFAGAKKQKVSKGPALAAMLAGKKGKVVNVQMKGEGGG